MKLNPIRCIIVVSLIACSTGCTSGLKRSTLANQKQCAISGEDYGLAVQFATQVQLAVQNKDARAFVHLGHYPVQLNQGGHHFIIDSSTLEV